MPKHWPICPAIAYCLRVLALDIESNPQGINPEGDTIGDILNEDTENDPRTEEGFRRWLNVHGGFSSEEIAAAVAEVYARS